MFNSLFFGTLHLDGKSVDHGKTLLISSLLYKSILGVFQTNKEDNNIENKTSITNPFILIFIKIHILIF